MSFASKILEAAESRDLLCLGIDPHPHILLEWGYEDSPEGLKRWTKRLQEELGEVQPTVVKPQVALFERMGVVGMQVLSDLIGGFRAQGVLVIGDAKRGDIGSTMKAYADAWLEPGRDFEVDALTVSPYLGLGALEPVLESALVNAKGVFVLAATSNPEATALQQSRRADGLSVAQGIVTELASWCEAHSDTQPGARDAGIGVVVGATVDQAEAGLDLGRTPWLPVLSPGFGAQGARLSEVSTLFPDTKIVIPTVSRSVLEGDPDLLHERFALARKELGG